MCPVCRLRVFNDLRRKYRPYVPFNQLLINYAHEHNLHEYLERYHDCERDIMIQQYFGSSRMRTLTVNLKQICHQPVTDYIYLIEIMTGLGYIQLEVDWALKTAHRFSRIGSQVYNSFKIGSMTKSLLDGNDRDGLLEVFLKHYQFPSYINSQIVTSIRERLSLEVTTQRLDQRPYRKFADDQEDDVVVEEDEIEEEVVYDDDDDIDPTDDETGSDDIDTETE